jgi:hypothetical protein
MNKQIKINIKILSIANGKNDITKTIEGVTSKHIQEPDWF